MTTTLDRFGRIVVPKAIRDRHGLVPGTEFEIEDSDGHIILRVLSHENGLAEKDDMLIFRGKSAGDVTAAVRAHRQERTKKKARM